MAGGCLVLHPCSRGTTWLVVSAMKLGAIPHGSPLMPPVSSTNHAVASTSRPATGVADHYPERGHDLLRCPHVQLLSEQHTATHSLHNESCSNCCHSPRNAGNQHACAVALRRTAAARLPRQLDDVTHQDCICKERVRSQALGGCPVLATDLLLSCKDDITR